MLNYICHRRLESWFTSKKYVGDSEGKVVFKRGSLSIGNTTYG